MSPLQPAAVVSPARGPAWTLKRPKPRVLLWSLGGVVALGGLAAWMFVPRPGGPPATPPENQAGGKGAASPADAGRAADGSVRLTEEQQAAIGLKTIKVVYGDSPRVSKAPGRVAPNEDQYALITPRAAGVVRSVTAHIGQEVKAGDLLATIDSPEVGEARLELYTRLQALDIAKSQADWQETTYANTLDLLEHLKKGETPGQVHEAFQGRAVGENREKLMTAYAEYRLARATIDRNRDLYAQKLITPKDYDRVNASYEVAQATYQSLMEEMGYKVKLEVTRARQTLRQSQTSVRAAQERLRILGVKSDGTEPPVEGGKVVGVVPGEKPAPGADGKDPVAASPETILPPRPDSSGNAATPPGRRSDAAPKLQYSPVSTYSIWAPFDGTILDREMIVPGVSVDTTHRIFTMANLDAVWIEASVHESDFEMLDRIRSRGGKVQFRSPAYPDKVFEGRVIYTGDLVEEQSRSVKLLAKAENPGRLLRPGMFVEAEVLSPRSGEVAQIPASAMLTEGKSNYVYVRSAPDLFARREVEAEAPLDDKVTIRGGLDPGDEVVVEGGYKLKARAVQLTNSGG